MGYPVAGTPYAAGGGAGAGGVEQGMGGGIVGAVNGMKYIPTLYAGKLLVKFYETSVLGEITNTDYEGQIRDQGDTVIIRTRPTINVADHQKGMVLADQIPTTEAVILNIDQGKYWSFRTDDPDMVQTDIKTFVNEWTDEASYEFRNAIEIDVLDNVAADAGQVGTILGIALGIAGTPITVSKSDIVDTVVDCGTILDTFNVPDQNRFFLLPPRLIGMIKKSELKDASIAGDGTSIVRNGMVGMVDRFTIFRTNNLKYTTTAGDNAWSCLFGTKHAITFASQLVKSKTIDNPTGFGMLHRGLHVYGYKVVKPEALGVLYAKV